MIAVGLGKREFLYIGYLIASLLIYAAAASAIFFLIKFGLESIFSEEIGITFGFIFSFFTVVFLFTRFELVYPAAAIGAKASFKDSWRATKGSSLRILTVYFFVYWLLFPLNALVSEIFRNSYVFENFFAWLSRRAEDYFSIEVFAAINSIMDSVPFLLATALIELFIVAVTVSSLSIIYKFLSEKDDAEASNA